MRALTWEHLANVCLGSPQSTLEMRPVRDPTPIMKRRKAMAVRMRWVRIPKIALVPATWNPMSRTKAKMDWKMAATRTMRMRSR